MKKFYEKWNFIQLIKFFLKSSCWSNPDDVGIATAPFYNGRPVISGTKTLNAFTSYMNSLDLTSLKFDHAVGLLE